MFRTALILAFATLFGCTGNPPAKAPAPTNAGQPIAKPTAPEPPKPQRGPTDPPLDVAAPPAGALRTEIGVHYVLIKEQSTDEKSPTASDKVKVHYRGWTTDGKIFDSSRERGTPAEFELDRMIAGFRDGIVQMKPGQEIRMWIPQELAYDGIPGAPQGMLVFEVELLEIFEKPPEDPALVAPPDVAAPPEDATVMASGLAFRVLQGGTGSESPRVQDEVIVHYTGWTTDGKRFDSSIERGKPATFPLDRVIPGWTEGLPLMVVGEKRRFWVPVDLAYKNKPMRPAGMLVFDIELLEIHKNPDPPPVPKHVAKPPRKAKRTKSGLRYVRIVRGRGRARPRATSKVTVHYSGWTTDGNMFDSSVTRGKPATFPLDRVIPGWTEALQLMRAGDTTRFWIPEELAYKGRTGAPQGMLVFDVQLLEFED